jgi:hypothetical protein
LQKHLHKLFTTPTFQWYSRDLFWDELAKFGLHNITDASEEIFLDCLASVHDSLR